MDIDADGFVEQFVYGDAYVSSIDMVVDELSPDHDGKQSPYVEDIVAALSEAPDEVLAVIPDIVALGAHAALFSMLAYLDSVRPIADGFDTEVVAMLKDADGSRELSPDQNMLAVFQSLAFQWRDESAARRSAACEKP